MIAADNQVTVLTNGDEIFPAMLAAINAAKHSIIFLTYVYWRGDIADEFAHRLSDKARAGVQVKVLIDAFGGNKINSELVQLMEDAGVEVRWFRPLRWYTLHKFNNRTHRKILVCDGRVGFVGGVGIADEWTGNAQDPDHWRDTHFSLTGSVALELIASFNENWEEAGGTPIETQTAAPKASKGVAVEVVSSTHAARRTEADSLFYNAIRGAKHSITITTAYFVPNRRFMRALMLAAQRGITVTILTNGSNTNQYLARKAGHHAYTRLLYMGVHLHEYQKTLLHAKIMTIDSDYAIVGSSNFDDRSFVLNDEVCVSFKDNGVVSELERQFERDLADARQIHLPNWQARALRSKIVERFSSLFYRQL